MNMAMDKYKAPSPLVAGGGVVPTFAPNYMTLGPRGSLLMASDVSSDEIRILYLVNLPHSQLRDSKVSIPKNGQSAIQMTADTK